MQLSRRGRYALSAMLELVLCQKKEKLLTAREIAKKQKIPLPFLEQLLLQIKKKKLIDAKRGPKGGYVLLKNPSEISAFDVLFAVEGPMAIIECLRPNTQCQRSASCCATRSLWEKMNRALFTILQETSLEDLCQKKEST